MDKSKKQRWLNKHFFLGLFFIITGIGFSIDVYVNRPYFYFFYSFNSVGYQMLWRTIVWAFLIVWNAVGLMMAVYGWLRPPSEESYEDD